MWCYDPACECYGVTDYFGSGIALRRPFTEAELIEAGLA